MSQMTAPVLRTTPLHSVHAAAGAFFTDADGWRMPLRYSCAPTEHRAVRTSAGIFDLSHMGEIKVTGPGAAAALDRALVGRVSTVALGRSLRTMMVTGAGGVIDVLMVHHVGEHEYMVVSGAGNRKRVVAELARRRDGHACTIDDISTATALITVQGPRTTEVLSGAVESGAGIPAALHPRETGRRSCAACAATRPYGPRPPGTLSCWPVPAARARTASNCSAARRMPLICGRSSPATRPRCQPGVGTTTGARYRC